MFKSVFYKVPVEVEIVSQFELWLKENDISYGYDIVRELPNARFRMFTIFCLFNRSLVENSVRNILEEFRKA